MKFVSFGAFKIINVKIFIKLLIVKNIEIIEIASLFKIKNALISPITNF